MSGVPEGWKSKKLSEVSRSYSGGTPSRERPEYFGVGVPWIKSGEVNQRIITNVEEAITDEGLKNSSAKLVAAETILVAMYGATAGKVGLTKLKAAINQALLAVVPNQEVADNIFLFGYLENTLQKLALTHVQGGQPNLNAQIIKNLDVLLPPLEEQRKIADILSTWDEAIEQQTRLLEMKRERKRGLMQQLLTGKVRFKEFEGLEWPKLPIGKIAKEVSERNKLGSDLPVLSCTKHKGLVDSLSYFGKQVYSKDTTVYKIVQRGTFAYATNHIEEGSIGYQSLYDRGLISPMYTVFKADPQVVDDRFLFAVLKTEHYRQIFAASMNASVNRRGSLRWKEFANINVPVPSLSEQQKIAAVLSAADAELETLEKQLSALRTQKRGLMQRLLTGKTRVQPS